MDRADIAEDPAVRNKRIQDIVNELELVGDKTRWNVPLIPQGMDPEEVRWIDSARPCNLYLSGWGGDYDGDMVSIKGLYTIEANEEANRLITAKKTLLDVAGGASRDVTKEGILALYALTE